MAPSIELTGLINPFIKGIEEIDAEYKNLLDLGLGKYLEDQTKKYLFTNTFLHRGEKVNFFDVYFPLKIKYDKVRTKFNDPSIVLEKYPFITLLGTAGCGKSTLVKFMFLNSIKTHYKIPILIELRHLNEIEETIDSFIASKILSSKIKPSQRIVNNALRKGKFLIILDGFDEIISQKKQLILAQIESFIDSFPDNKVVITSRPGAGLENSNRFFEYEVLSFRKTEIISFINMMVQDEERKKRIIKTVGSPENNDYINYLQNPLLLSMFLLAYESHPEIPKRRNAFYRNVFDTLYSKHDGITKQSFPREKITGLQREDFENILQYFSYLTYFRGQISFTDQVMNDTLIKIKETLPEYDFKVEHIIYDLRTSISILLKDGFEYKFPHRSLQEYFVALFISRLSTDKKKKLYERMATLDHMTSDSNMCLWGLCQELDESGFSEYFIIPILDNIIFNLGQEKNIESIKSFMNLFDPVLAFENNQFTMPLRSIRDNHIIRFLRIYSLNDFYSFFRDPSIGKQISQHLEVIGIELTGNLWLHIREDNDEGIWNDTFLQILYENNFHIYINRLRLSLVKKVTQLRNTLEIRNTTLDDLLNL